MQIIIILDIIKTARQMSVFRNLIIAFLMNNITFSSNTTSTQHDRTVPAKFYSPQLGVWCRGRKPSDIIALVI